MTPIDIEREIRILRSLLEALDCPPDTGVEEAWCEELERRNQCEADAVSARTAGDMPAKRALR